MLFVPFFIMYLQGIDISFSHYLQILLQVTEGNAISRLLTNFSSCPMEERIYLSVSAGVYILSFYQNFILCLKFCRNLRKINDELSAMKQYLLETISKMEKLLDHIHDFKTFHSFKMTLDKQCNQLKGILSTFSDITDFGIHHNKVHELGKLLKVFYSIYESEVNVNTLLYSFGFNGFIEILTGVSVHIQSQKINACLVVKMDKKKKKKKVISMKSLYYAGLIQSGDEDIVKNTVKFDKHFILTGPNASGKTTLLKAIFLNVILSQQIGYGCYSSYTCIPYHHFHCYLNISDSSGRDSLFQSESKKCKMIIDSLNKSSADERHFCAFDELFSGTNPDEAVNCGYGFLTYLCKQPKCALFLLTTHYLELCQKLANESKIEVYKMVVDKQNDDIKYTYVINKGYNTVNGGCAVLKQLQFPDEIINIIDNIKDDVVCSYSNQ